MTILLRLPEVKKQTGLSKSSIYSLMSEDEFPNQVKLGERAVGWLDSEIADWIESKVSASRNALRRER